MDRLGKTTLKTRRTAVLGRATSTQATKSSPTPDTAAFVIRAELTGSDTCSALGITARGDAPVLKLCRALVAAGYDPATALHVYRGPMLALKVCTVGEGAR